MTPDELVRQLREAMAEQEQERADGRYEKSLGSYYGSTATLEKLATPANMAALLDAVTAAQGELERWKSCNLYPASYREAVEEAARLRQRVQELEATILGPDGWDEIVSQLRKQVSALQGELAEAQAKQFAALVKCEEQALAESERLVAERDVALTELADAREYHEAYVEAQQEDVAMLVEWASHYRRRLKARRAFARKWRDERDAARDELAEVRGMLITADRMTDRYHKERDAAREALVSVRSLLFDSRAIPAVRHPAVRHALAIIEAALGQPAEPQDKEP